MFKGALSMLSLIVIFSATAVDKVTEPLWITDIPQAKSPKDAPSFSLENQLFTYLNTHFIDVPFKIIQANNRRAQSFLEGHLAACTGNKLKTQERLQRFPMSDLPQSVFLGQRLFSSGALSHQAVKQSLNPQGRVQLSQLLQQYPDLIFGVEDGRSYGDKVDSIIKHAEQNRPIYRRHDGGTSRGTVQMLLAERIHLLIEYPDVLQHYQRNSAQLDASVASYSITELDRYHAGFMMCSASVEGEQLMQKLNLAIRQASQQREYLQLHLNWYNEDVHAELTQAYNEVFGTQF